MRQLLVCVLLAVSACGGSSEQRQPPIPPQIGPIPGVGAHTISMDGYWHAGGVIWSPRVTPAPLLPPLRVRVEGGKIAEMYYPRSAPNLPEWGSADPDTFASRVPHGQGVWIESFVNHADGRWLIYGFAGWMRGSRDRIVTYVAVGTTPRGTLEGEVFTFENGRERRGVIGMRRDLRPR